MTSSARTFAPAPKFDPQNDFRAALKSRVASYFEDHGVEERDQPAMYRKTIAIMTWFIASYSLLVFAPIPIWGRILAAISLGFAGAGIGFSIMHDAGHGAYSKSPRVNRLVFLSLDFLGGSSYIWNIKHNILHHTYANVMGHDDDIDMGFLGRLAPEQEHRPFHRLQHLYIWGLYGLMVLKWHIWDDYKQLITGRVGEKAIPKMKPRDIAVFVGGKAFFYTYAFVIPSLIFGIGWTFAFYLLVSFVHGVIMATVFQLAHCVEEANFYSPDEDARLPLDWASHQVMTTVDFAPKNKLVSWYVGGLNFQVVHHLFPRISHIHYPALSEIVAETCQEYGLPYRVQPTLAHGIRSHYRWLKEMGAGESRPQLA